MPEAPGRISVYQAQGLLLAVIVLFSPIRLRLLWPPLEPDEGEYAYAGQLRLKGIPPYQLACNMHFPGAVTIQMEYSGHKDPKEIVACGDRDRASSLVASSYTCWRY